MLKAGDDHTPSHTRQKSYVEAVIRIIENEICGQQLIDLVRRI
jgi:hypothetical protein